MELLHPSSSGPPGGVIPEVLFAQDKGREMIKASQRVNGQSTDCRKPLPDAAHPWVQQRRSRDQSVRRRSAHAAGPFPLLRLTSELKWSTTLSAAQNGSLHFLPGSRSSFHGHASSFAFGRPFVLFSIFFLHSAFFDYIDGNSFIERPRLVADVLSFLSTVRPAFGTPRNLVAALALL